MIEALSNYWLAKKASEKAAADLGRVFGEAFGKANPDVKPDIQRVEDLASDKATLHNLRNVLGPGVSIAYSGFIKTSNSGHDVGLNLENQSFPHTDASRVPLEERAFVEGFADGFQQTRR
jgi:hypothetical protein